MNCLCDHSGITRGGIQVCACCSDSMTDCCCGAWRLQGLLSQTYTPAGVKIWLAHAERQGWTREEQIVKARAMAEGTFV